MYFDTHAHYDDKQFNDNRMEVLDIMESAGISLILNAASSEESAEICIELADKYEFIYASIGVHPHDAKTMNDDSITNLNEMLKHPKAMAVGEIGLDYHYDYSPRDIQKNRFREQLELAREINKPVIVHEREALVDTLDMIREFRDLVGVVHCFSGSWETAKIILDCGWYLSFTGVITYKNARKALDAVEKIPADRIMIETDSPYLSPEPVRGKQNTSMNLPHIAAKIAEIRGIGIDEVAKLTMENGKRFFGIK
ncbi:MAG: TatD family hydrolase [Oscillospiraceae bacterium]|nr:TatD family hydrolase [Oscillospiraceae bacterium]